MPPIRVVSHHAATGTGGDGTGQLTGAVRAAVEDMWNELKRMHFLDSRTRVLTVTLQLRSNSLGVRYRNTLMFEQMAAGTWFTSYDTETRVLHDDLVSSMKLYASLSLALVIFFCIMEVCTRPWPIAHRPYGGPSEAWAVCAWPE